MIKLKRLEVSVSLTMALLIAIDYLVVKRI